MASHALWQLQACFPVAFWRSRMGCEQSAFGHSSDLSCTVVVHTRLSVCCHTLHRGGSLVVVSSRLDFPHLALDACVAASRSGQQHRIFRYCDAFCRRFGTVVCSSGWFFPVCILLDASCQRSCSRACLSLPTESFRLHSPFWHWDVSQLYFFADS